MRLQKYMAMCGVAARRKCEEIIASGRVAVNGETITQMGTQVEEGDVVTLDGQVITPEEEKRYILYHKPAGEVTTVSDDKGRETVMDRFADFPVRLYPVGRLDYDSEGLLLLTNDGELAQRLTHPSCEVDKVYLARVTGNPSNEALDKLRRGVYMEGRRAPHLSRAGARGARRKPVLRYSGDDPRGPKPTGAPHVRQRGAQGAAASPRAVRPGWIWAICAGASGAS